MDKPLAGQAASPFPALVNGLGVTGTGEPSSGLPRLQRPVHRNRQLALIRLSFISLQLVFVWLSELLFGLALPQVWLTALLLLWMLSGIRLLVFGSLAPERDNGDAGYLLELIIDVAMLSLIVGYSGGPANPFVSYYLVPIIVAVLTLRRTMMAVVIGLAVIAYSAMLFWQLGLGDTLAGSMAGSGSNADPHAHHMAGMASGMTSDMASTHASSLIDLHLAGMWLNFLLTVGLILLFVIPLARALRLAQQEATAQQERMAQDERLLAMATMGASVMHRLATPINTLVMLLDDIQSQERNQYQLAQEDVLLMERALQQCRSTLAQLPVAGEQTQASERSDVILADHIDTLVDELSVLRPSVRVSVGYDAMAREEVLLPPSWTVLIDHAFLNLLDNAMKGGDGKVTIKVQALDTMLCVEISNVLSVPGRTESEATGGYKEEPVRVAGAQRSSAAEPEGLGIGLMLSHSAIERSGGSLMQYSGGGNITFRLQMPR